MEVTSLVFLTILVAQVLTQEEDYEGELFDTTEAVLPPGEGYQLVIDYKLWVFVACYL